MFTVIAARLAVDRREMAALLASLRNLAFAGDTNGAPANASGLRLRSIPLS
jgi:hypothetical protein